MNACTAAGTRVPAAVHARNNVGQSSYDYDDWPTLLIFGKTISGTDANMGRSRLPKPLTVAGMTKKKIINIAWARWAGR